MGRGFLPKQAVFLYVLQRYNVKFGNLESQNLVSAEAPSRGVNLVQNAGGRPVQGSGDRSPPVGSRGEAPVGGLGDRSPPVGSRGEAPVGGLGDEVPQKLKQFCISIRIILT